MTSGGWDSVPRLPLCYFRLLLQALSSVFQALNVLYYFQKITEITHRKCSVLFLQFCAYFSLQTLLYLLVEAQKYFLPPDACYLYATDKIIGVGFSKVAVCIS